MCSANDGTVWPLTLQTSILWRNYSLFSMMCWGRGLSLASLGLTNCQHSGETKVTNNRREQQSCSPLLAMYCIGNTCQRLTTMYFTLWWCGGIPLPLTFTVLLWLACLAWSVPLQLRLLTAGQTRPPAGAGLEGPQGREPTTVRLGRIGQFGWETASSGQPQILTSHMMTLQSSYSTDSKTREINYKKSRN